MTENKFVSIKNNFKLKAYYLGGKMKRLVITAGLLLVTSFNSVKSGKIHAPIRLTASTQSYDPRIFGTWEVKTVVTDSNCRYVSEGEKSFSKIKLQFN